MKTIANLAEALRNLRMAATAYQSTLHQKQRDFAGVIKHIDDVEAVFAEIIGHMKQRDGGQDYKIEGIYSGFIKSCALDEAAAYANLKPNTLTTYIARGRGVYQYTGKNQEGNEDIIVISKSSYRSRA